MASEYDSYVRVEWEMFVADEGRASLMRTLWKTRAPSWTGATAGCCSGSPTAGSRH